LPKSSNKELVLVLDNLRSAHNVGSIFRSAEAFDVSRIILTGISPYPTAPDDTRLPHIRARAEAAIAKTALGAEKSVPFEYQKSPAVVADKYRQAGYKLYALELTNKAVNIRTFKPRFPSLLVVGNELSGVNQTLIDGADEVLQIPTAGRKSLNVAVATSIALYQLLIS